MSLLESALWYALVVRTGLDVRRTLFLAPLPEWRAAATAAASLVLVASLSITVSHPHGLAARSFFAAAALLLLLGLSAFALKSPRPFSRERRLGTFLALCAIGLGWWGAWQWVDAREADYHFTVQKAALKSSVTDLSRDILAFAVARQRSAPRPPRPATWDQDVDASLKYEAATVAEFDKRFGAQVRLTHDFLALLGITDHDFELFYKDPGNALAIVVVGQRLAVLAAATDHVR